MGVLVQQHSTTLQYTTEVGCHSGEWYHRSRNHLLPGQQGKSQHALGAQGNNYYQAQCATTILSQHSHTCNDPPNTTTTTIWASGQLSLRLLQVCWGLIVLGFEWCRSGEFDTAAWHAYWTCVVFSPLMFCWEVWLLAIHVNSWC